MRYLAQDEVFSHHLHLTAYTNQTLYISSHPVSSHPDSIPLRDVFLTDSRQQEQFSLDCVIVIDAAPKCWMKLH